MFTTFTFQWCRKEIEMGEGGGLTWNKSWQAGKGERKRLMVKVKSNFAKKIRGEGGGHSAPLPYADLVSTPMHFIRSMH